MRSHLAITVLALFSFGCADASPTSLPAEEAVPLSVNPDGWHWDVSTFTLPMAPAEDSPSEAWGVFQLRAGLAPPNPCSPWGRGRVPALTVCGVVYNPAEERLDAVSFEVMQHGAEQPTVLRGFVSAPPNPCNLALLQGVLPAELANVESVVASLETDVGMVVSNGPEWPGAFPSAPPNPCVLTVTLG